MMALAEQVAAQLRETGAFDVRLSREDGEQVTYRERMRRAKRWGAEAFVSLHSDARGAYSVDADGCRVNNDDPGFSVLYSDEGPMAAQRMAMASAIAGRMGQAGFLPYQGDNYVGLYEGLDGVFVDRHEPRKRIMFLRRPAMPSVIVETHNALDARAAARWQEAQTVSVFSAALAAGLIDWLEDGP